MSKKTVCAVCGSDEIDRLHGFRCFCKKCQREQKIEMLTKPKQRKLSPQERNRQAVYATGNKWAIENYKATQ